jgi:predicted PurR-regulated permease PerM
MQGMDMLLVVLLSIILVVAFIWGLMITFFWWELIQLRKVRYNMSEYPDKLDKAIDFMEKIGKVTNELKEEVLPIITSSTGDIRVLGTDLKVAMDELIKLSKSMRDKPPWYDALLNALIKEIDNKFEVRLKQVETAIRRLRQEE